jgi:hypothetical protein
MECNGFLERFSEYYDGEAADAGTFERHLTECAGCRRYTETVTRSLALLRVVPGVAVCDDFHPRLQHRIYHIREDLARRRRGAPFTRLGVAFAATILLALAVWGPELVRETPQVALPPIVVSEPSSLRTAAPSATVRYRDIRLRESGLDGDDLWSRALYEYSPLSQR